MSAGNLILLGTNVFRTSCVVRTPDIHKGQGAHADQELSWPVLRPCQHQVIRRTGGPVVGPCGQERREWVVGLCACGRCYKPGSICKQWRRHHGSRGGGRPGSPAAVQTVIFTLAVAAPLERAGALCGRNVWGKTESYYSAVLLHRMHI
jgi:hypothetical protein